MFLIVVSELRDLVGLERLIGRFCKNVSSFARVIQEGLIVGFELLIVLDLRVRWFLLQIIFPFLISIEMVMNIVH